LDCRREEEQTEMIELLQSARNLLLQYRNGAGDSKLALGIANKIEKVLIDTGAIAL
jgi:hypothetical protein